MYKNIEKSLYIAISLILFIVALSSFMVCQNQFKEYFNKSTSSINYDKSIIINRDEVEEFIYGHELIHLYFYSNKVLIYELDGSIVNSMNELIPLQKYSTKYYYDNENNISKIEIDTLNTMP